MTPVPPCGSLCDDGAGRGALVSPRGRQHADRLVVPGQTVDARLDQNQAKLGVPVFPVTLEMLAHGHGLGGLVGSSREGSAGGGDLLTFLINM